MHIDIRKYLKTLVHRNAWIPNPTRKQLFVDLVVQSKPFVAEETKILRTCMVLFQGVGIHFLVPSPSLTSNLKTMVSKLGICYSRVPFSMIQLQGGNHPNWMNMSPNFMVKLPKDL